MNCYKSASQISFENMYVDGGGVGGGGEERMKNLVQSLSTQSGAEISITVGKGYVQLLSQR